MTNTKPERRLAITPGTNIRWERSYGIGREVYWCLVSDESAKEDRCINPYTVLFASCDNDMGGQPLNEQPDLAMYADAHNVYNSCHLTPSEMLAELTKLRSERDDLVGALNEVLAGTAWYGIDGGALAKALSILAKHKPE